MVCSLTLYLSRPRALSLTVKRALEGFYGAIANRSKSQHHDQDRTDQLVLEASATSRMDTLREPSASVFSVLTSSPASIASSMKRSSLSS